MKGLACGWSHCIDCGLPPDITTVTLDFFFANTESDDDGLTIFARKEKPFQTVGASVHPDLSTSELVLAMGIGYLDSWGHREVMIKCDQKQSTKRTAELF